MFVTALVSKERVEEIILTTDNLDEKVKEVKFENVKSTEKKIPTY